MNRLAQPPDRFGQIGMFGGQIGLGGQNFVQFLLGPQIDAAEPLTVLLQSVEPLFHILSGRKFVAWRDRGEAEKLGLACSQ